MLDSCRIQRKWVFTVLMLAGLACCPSWGAIPYPIHGASDEIMLSAGILEGIAYHPISSQVATCGNLGVMVWQAENGSLLQWFKSHKKPVYYIKYSPDGKNILSLGEDRVIRLWEVSSGKEIMLIPEFVVNSKTAKSQYACEFSSDSNFLLLYDGSRVRLYNLKTQSQIKTLPSFKSAITAAAFAVQSKQILLANNGVVTLWDWEKNKEVRKYSDVPRNSITFISMSRDGKRMLTGGNDFTRLWDLNTGKIVNRFASPSIKFKPLGFSADSNWLLVSESKNVHVWICDAQTGQRKSELWHSLPGQIDAKTQTLITAAFSPDSKQVMTVKGNSVIIWETTTGNRLLILNGHLDTIFDAAFSPQGKRVLTGSFDGTARIWMIADMITPPAPTSTPTPKPTKIPAPTRTPKLKTPTPISSTPTPTSTPTSTPTDTPVPTSAPTEIPTATPEPPTATPVPPTPTDTPLPTSTPTEVPTATPEPPTATPVPPTPTDTPEPTSTSTPTEVPLASATPTEAPTLTPTPTPSETPTPELPTPEPPTPTPELPTPTPE